MRLLIAEDERDLAEALSVFFEKNQFTVDTVYNGFDAYEYAVTGDYDAIVLDVMMPIMDGWQVCKIIRKESKVPIIIMTAKGETFDKVNGLEMGADDYIVKPLEMREVIARVRAIFRRLAPEDSGKISFDKLTVDKQAYDLIVDGKRVDAPPKEIELLYFLASNPNRVFTRAQLLDDVWGFDYFGDTRTVDVHVKRLREKLEGVSDKWDLKTVWGVGYKFETRD